MNFFLYLFLLTAAILYIIIKEGSRINKFGLIRGRIIIGKVTVSDFLLCSVSLSLILLCALRPFEETYDTGVYIDWLEEERTLSFFQFNGRFRPGFELLSKIILLVCGSNYRIYFAILVALNCVVVLKAISNLDCHEGISFILYIGFIGLYYNYIVIRTGLAISCVILAYSYLNSSKKKTLICLVAAILFHESTLIVILALILKKYILPIKKRKLYFIIGIAVLLYFTKLFDNLFYEIMLRLVPHLPAAWFHTYILYIDKPDANYTVSLYYLLCYGLTFLLVYRYSGRFKDYDNYLALNIIGQFGFSLFSTNTITARFWDYLVATSFVLLIPKIFRQKGEKKIICLSVFLLTLSLYSRIILLRVPFYF